MVVPSITKPCEVVIHTKTVDEKQVDSEKRAKEEILRKIVIKTPQDADKNTSQSMMV